MRTARPIRRGVALLLLAVTAACARQRTPGPTPEPAPQIDPAQVESVIFLVGDAGEARQETHPILHKLRQDIEWWAGQVQGDSAITVLYLGDIVYPVGMNSPGTDAYSRDSAVVMDQVTLIAGPNARSGHARGFFMAGNHDWGLEKEWEGFVRLAALRDFLALARQHTGADVILAPEAGTGGPHVVDLGQHVRILIMDSAWWLLHSDSPEDAPHQAVVEGIEEAIRTAGDREIMFASHHPFRTAGPHGGEISFWRTLGFRYLLVRSGALLQDVTSLPYRELEARLREIFARHGPPLASLGGHEHSLQVLYAIEPTDPTYSVVSGSASKLSSVGRADGLQFGRRAPGYMKVVVERNGRISLFVEAVPEAYQSCSGDDAAREACVAAGVAAFETVHSQRLR